VNVEIEHLRLVGFWTRYWVYKKITVNASRRYNH